MEDIANLKYEEVESGQFYVLSHHPSILEGLKRLLQMPVNRRAMSADAAHGVINDAKALKTAWKKALEEIPYLESMQNVIQAKTDPFIKSLQSNVSLTTEYWKERSLLAVEWSNIRIEKAFFKNH